jgi:CDP-ribitol ribitolphosphotransferase
MTISQLLCVADLCISDYSSLVFEYALFERQMVFYAPDLEQYFDERGFYYDYDTLTPGPVFREQEALINYVKGLNLAPTEQVQSFRQRFMSACDGHATERILDYIGIM